MPYTAIYQDQYAVDRPTLDDDLAFLSELACAHLTHYLSTPASSMTWSPEMAGRIQAFLTHVATKRPKVKPSAVLRTILVIARYQEENPEIVAYNDEAELLFYIAFTKVAKRFDPNFHNALALSFMDASEDMTRRFGFFDEQVDDEVEAELHPKQRDMTAAKALAALEFFLAPLVDETVRRGFGGGMNMKCPTMPLTSPLKPVVRGRAQQKLLFPVIPYDMKTDRLLSISEEDEDEEYVERLESALEAYVEDNESALFDLIGEPSLFDFADDASRISSAISTMPSIGKSDELAAGHSSILSVVVEGSEPTLSSEGSFYSAVDTLDHAESTTSSESMVVLSSLQSIDSIGTNPSIPPEKHTDPLARWWYPDDNGQYPCSGLGDPPPPERRLRSFVYSTRVDPEHYSVAQDAKESFVGGVVHMVAAKLGLSRTRGRPSRVRKALFALGLPVAARPRRPRNV